MLRGVYNVAGGSAHELQARARLDAVAAESELVVRGPLAIAATSSLLSSAEVDGITCVVDGCLYDPTVLAAELGLDSCEHAELLARAYRRLGTSVLARVRGRFSVVVWDSVREQGVLACDLLATKQLFVCRRDGALIFAGELHELLSLVASRPAPDSSAFTTWLADGTCPEGRTLYRGVSRLGPGKLIALGAGRAEPQVYWRPRHAETMRGDPTELATGLREELRRATRRRVSASSNAVILSGGLDSSIVTAVARQEKPPDARLQTYSAVFPGAEFDESTKIRALTQGLGIEPATFQIRPQGTLWLALQYTKRWQLPLIAAGSVIDIATVAEAARDGAEVVLDGQTGDELFGFSPYVLADRLRQGRVRSALRLAGRWPIGRPTTLREKLLIFRELGVKGAAPYRLARYVRGRRGRDALAPPWLLPNFREQYIELEDRWAWKLGASGPLWWRYLADVLVAAPHREFRFDYLRHRAVAEGVVNESPLYDVDLIDYCLRLPPELAFDSRFDRPLVREAMSGWLPEEVRLQTQKSDFTSFCQNALTTNDSPGIDRLLTAPDAEIGAYVDLEWVRRNWSRLLAGHGDSRWVGTVWRLAAAECWLRAQADPGFPDTMLAQPDVLPPEVRSVAFSA